VRRLKLWPVALLLAALHAAAGRAAEDFAVEADRSGTLVDVRARAVVAAPVDLVWRVITDYERLPQFIPGISRSVVRRRLGHRLVLEQSGEARFFIFSFPIEVTLEVVEQPREWVASRAVAGNVRRMDGRYEIQADPARGGVWLRYFGAIEPDFFMPPLLGTAALRGTAEEQFAAMVAEIERRAAAGETGK
jgi:ribosome-associated toxin RatA of RatAB toxin-antitoxin module